MRDLLKEISASVRNNKMRIALTGFSVGWGLFILIVLLGSGNGIMNGITKSFGSDTICVVHLKPGRTQMVFNGMDKGRRMIVREDDAMALRKDLGESVARDFYCCSSPSLNVRRGNVRVSTSLIGVQARFLKVNSKQLIAGSDITELNMERAEHTCLIGKQTADLLFPDGSSPIGQTVSIDSIPFTVMGVYDSTTGSKSGHTVYAPFTTVKKLYAPDGSLSEWVFVADGIDSEEDYTGLQDKIYSVLGKRLNFSPKDHAAIECSNDFLDYLQLKIVLTMLQAFIWIIGLATLIAGVVSISNIMLISVKERTRELGIRKAMGATDAHIITLVLLESVFVSLVFGYFGMILGIGLTQLLAWLLAMAGGAGFFDNPTVGLWTVIVANLIMVISGLIAGYYPARNAVRIKLVDALMA